MFFDSADKDWDGEGEPRPATSLELTTAVA